MVTNLPVGWGQVGPGVLGHGGVPKLKCSDFYNLYVYGAYKAPKNTKTCHNTHTHRSHTHTFINLDQTHNHTLTKHTHTLRPDTLNLYIIPRIYQIKQFIIFQLLLSEIGKGNPEIHSVSQKTVQNGARIFWSWG